MKRKLSFDKHFHDLQSSLKLLNMIKTERAAQWTSDLVASNGKSLTIAFCLINGYKPDEVVIGSALAF